MSKGGLISLALAVLAIAFFVFLGNGGNPLKGVDFYGGVEKEVKFSVVRFNGEVVSVELVVNGSGKLETRHRIPEDKVGVAYYKQEALVRRIESRDSYRYLPSGGGFTNEVVTKEVRVK